MFQVTQKSQFYFSRDHCCEVTVKNVRKSIFSINEDWVELTLDKELTANCLRNLYETQGADPGSDGINVG